MQALLETLKEMARLAVFAAVSAFVASLSQSVSKLDPNTVTLVLTLVLRGVDKWVHKSAFQAKGILPF